MGRPWETGSFYLAIKEVVRRYLNKPPDDQPTVSELLGALAHVQWELHAAAQSAQAEARERAGDREEGNDATADEGYLR